MSFRAIAWLAAIAIAAAGEMPPDLSGAWQLDPARSQVNEPLQSAALTIEHKPDRISLVEEEVLPGGRLDKLQVRCGTMGEPCKFKDGRDPVEVSVWHSGSRLVIMELRGKNRDQVTRKRLELASDGKSLTVEVTHIAPPGEKNETLVYARK